MNEARERARLGADLEPGVQYVRSTFVPTDEFVLHVFEAPSADVLRRAGKRVALQYPRIVEEGRESKARLVSAAAGALAAAALAGGIAGAAIPSADGVVHG